MTSLVNARKIKMQEFVHVVILFLLVLSVFSLALSGSTHTADAASTSNVLLTLTARPPVLPADKGSYRAIVIQFLDASTKLPVIPSSSVTVYLSSSNPQTGTVPSTVVYPPGKLYYDVNFTTTSLPGTTAIYAVAQGYQPVNLTLKTETVGGIPTALLVYLGPNDVMARWNTTSNVIVQAVDAFGNPVKLGSSVAVSLSSSNTLAGNLPSSVTIPADESYVQTEFTATATPGQTVITASAEGLAPGSAVMTTVDPSGAPDALEIQFAPPVLFSDGGSYQNVVVEAVDSNTSQAAPVMQNTIVNITSSASSIGKVQGFLEIPAGQSYATASFATYGLAGSTTITATASDFASAQGKLVLVTKAATTLGLYAVPSVVVSSNHTYNNLIVQLHDPSGNPEKTTVPVQVSLQSLNPATGTVPSSVTIPAGSTYATIPLTTTTTAGQIEIAAFATGFQLGQVTLNSTLLTLGATLTPSPEVVQLGGTSNIGLQVNSGNFAVPNATVHWTVTSGLVSPASSSTNGTGYSSARVVAHTVASTITINARITAPGYAPKLATLTLIINAPPAHASGILGILLINIIFIPLYMLIIAAGAAGGGVTAFFLIKRRGSYEEVVEGDEI
ncbi:MAG: hypothetical protein JRN15_23790 [Nitrososphaerota archaeon]|nr:hypothetical protein [Nitrososphaerota archaeon]